jgi:uncharacterized protein (UPF0262 family)
VNDTETPGGGTGRAAASPAGERIVAIDLDEKSIARWSPEVEHERNVAIFDLLEDNHFALKEEPNGPYRLLLSLRDATLVFALEDASGRTVELTLPARPLKRVIKDYFMICESYFGAIRGAAPGRIEAIDMARRGLHNEGAELLQDALADRVTLDGNTARRLFTLVCVLHLRG